MLPVQVSAKHRIIGVPTAPAIANLFPAARPMDFRGAPHLVLPHGLSETFILRKLGYDVPSPIMTHYDWAGGTPFEVQRKTCAMLTMHKRAYVLNDMGTGKTKSALWAWDYLRGNGVCGKVLVLAPLSTLTFVWAREVLATLPHRKCVVLHGSKAKRIERLNDPDAEIFILNHDGIKVVGDELAKRTDISALIIDELAVYRNPNDRTKKTRKLAERMEWVWGMTGSPIPTCPTNAWAQATIVTPTTVPKYFKRFQEELMTHLGGFIWKPKPDAIDRAFAALQPAVRYKLDDVVELPECIERTLDVAMGPKQADVYKKLAAECYVAVQNKEITAANAGAVMQKLLQVATGWVYSKNREAVVLLDNDNRCDALIDSVLASERKVLVFVPFKHALAGISEKLAAEKIEHAVVSGDTPAGERADIFNAFQNTSKYHAIAAHPQCLAHGVTLTAADTVIWFAPVTSLEIYEQANRRIRRIGQKHKQLVLHLQSTPVEKRIYSLLQKNKLTQEGLLALFEEASRDSEA